MKNNNNLTSKDSDQFNLDSESLACHEEPDEWWEIHNSEYIHYVYKITNKVNKMFYYGIHSTLKSLNKEPINDGYWGSGTGIKEAIRLEGIENFTKEIVEIFETRQEVLRKEAEIVTVDLVKDPNCYNRIVGGGNSPLGKVIVTLKDDPNSKVFSVDREEFYKNKDKYETTGSGKVPVYLIEDGTVTDKAVCISQEEYLKYKDIKYKSVTGWATKGKVRVVAKDDPERKVVVMDIDDPRYISGEFVGVSKGVKQSKETIAKRTGERNGAYGSIWVTNGKENKMIHIGEEIPEGWRKGRLISQEWHNTIAECKKLDAEVLTQSGKLLKIKLDSVFFRKDNNELITPEYLQSLYKNLTTWKKVAKKLGISPRPSLIKIRNFYKSLGYNL